MSININSLHIGDIVMQEYNHFNSYVYSVVLGVDCSGMIRHKEFHEHCGTRENTTSALCMSPFPLSEAILKAHGWDYVDGGPLMVRSFDDKLIGIRKSMDGDGFLPVVFPGCFVDRKVAIVLNCVHGVHELQALLDALGCRLKVEPLIMKQ